MKRYKIKPFSNISSKGLDRIKNTICFLDEESGDPDGILVRSNKIEKEVLEPSLKAISRAGVGVNNIPVELCTKKGIVVFNTPGANANAVKELVLAGLMLSSRNVFSSIDFVKNLGHLKKMEDLVYFLEENKKKFKGRELSGSTLGIVGLGAIGSQVAKMGVALDMKVVGYDPAISVEAAWKLPSQVEPVDSIEDLFSRGDFITLHIPVLEETIGLVNEKLLKLVSNACLLNFARHEIVSDKAILKALKDKTLVNMLGK